MIVSASYRSDIPAFISKWFAQCLANGEVMVANPHSGKPYRVALTGDGVNGYVFWSRYMRPFRDNLGTLTNLGLPFMVQYTATAYPRLLETSVIHAEQAIADIRDLSRKFHHRAVVWILNNIRILLAQAA